MPKPNEIAVLTVNGQLYQDWETVLVRHARKEWPFYYFRFTCSEPTPFAKSWGVLRIRPGDWCEVSLAGQPAFSGMVHTRQVYFDKQRHYVEIQGCSQVIALTYSSVVSKTMENNKVNYEQYARGLLKPFPKIGFQVVGGKLPDFKFPRISIAPGTSVAEALEIPLRSLGSIDLSSNIKGDLVAIVGTNGETDTVTEGVDMLEGREIIYQPGYEYATATEGQGPGGDQVNGPQAAQQLHNNTQKSSVGSDLRAQGVIPLELPAFAKSMLENRVNADRNWQTQDWITVYATVQGWLRRNGQLWNKEQNVSVKSPMLIMDGLSLMVKTVTFSQEDSNSGTRTVLELCNAAAMQGTAPAENK
jgi:prophage tail gpP-like protein